jgi:hypothetical protein
MSGTDFTYTQNSRSHDSFVYFSLTIFGYQVGETKGSELSSREHFPNLNLLFWYIILPKHNFPHFPRTN